MSIGAIDRVGRFNVHTAPYAGKPTNAVTLLIKWDDAGNPRVQTAGGRSLTKNELDLFIQNYPYIEDAIILIDLAAVRGT